MTALYAPVLAVCGCSLVCILVSTFVSDGGTKRIVSLVMGAFILCSLLLPVKNAVQSVSVSLDGYQSAEELTATADEALQRQVLAQTRENLSQTLNALLLQNGISVNRSEFTLSDAGGGSIIIADVCIYIDKGDWQSESQIRDITNQSFGVTPHIITE